MAIRDLVSETLSQHYTLHKNDISVPVASIPEFVQELHTSVAATYPLFKVVIFGHVGDGNLHVNVLKPTGLSDKEFWQQCHEADHTIFNLVQRYRGSISAEHGVGLLKKDFLEYSRTPVEIVLMRQIKGAFDPYGIMNPGKIF
jgi:FAD/FMN-containing dehydrogenase